jgi:putative GTP pyrophosphokinase
MNETEFIERWTKDRSMYEAWGQFAVKQVMDSVGKKLSPIAADIFVRIPPKPRLKGDASILEKAFYRNKTYADPYEEITDKVGVRFVVLITDHIHVIEDAILACTDWEASKDRDFEQEQNPIQFDYAAVHYVVRCRSELKIDSMLIEPGTPCEIQVKTILQHAYGELTHDTIYKPTVTATSQMRRAAAKSMALIEATNDYFKHVVEEVDKIISPNKMLTDNLSRLYVERVKHAPEVTRAEGLIIEAFKDDIDADLLAGIASLIDSKPYLSERISLQASTKLLFRQPSILTVYFLADTRPSNTKEKWPLTPDELRPIYVDLGKAFDSY